MSNYLGIEFGSTRIKAVVIDEKYNTVSQGDFTWKSEYRDGIWTHDTKLAISGMREAVSGLSGLESVKCAGISGMMHGYLAFDKNWRLLVPYRNWQNTVTGGAAKELTALFNFNIPQRWSIAHLYQAILNGEEHVKDIAHITSLEGYIHYLLTGVNAVGIGDASGIFPVDGEKLCYNGEMLAKFDKLTEKYGLPWKIEDILPRVLTAGDGAGSLTKDGAALLGDRLAAGTAFCPPEGDAGTGMVATCAVRERRGNISAGTSVFSMIVLERPLKKVYPQIDIVTTPAGKPVAMAHCNNCTADSNAWVSVLKETALLCGADVSDGELFTALYKKSLEGDPDCGGVLVCNYLTGEIATDFPAGRPMVVRTPDCRFTLANFFRACLFSALATQRIGLDILADEHIAIDSLTGHGGLFKTPGVGQRYTAAALNTPVTVMNTAGEGGPWGMALLACYRIEKGGLSLEDFLEKKVFANAKSKTVYPDETDAAGFTAYLEKYKKLLDVERSAVENI